MTVLTSLDAPTLASVGVSASPLDQVVRLAELAKASGLDGVVASPQETAAIREACGPDFVIVTPGIRGGSAAAGPDDQQRTLTPADAVAAGSSYLVVGRPITGAPDPREAARQIAESAKTMAQTSSSPSAGHDSASLRRHHEVPAPVLRPAGLGFFPADRLFLALADDRDARGGNAETDQVVAHG